ncbi:MAG: beta-N-acetylhexosaminidase [Bacteroidales bacterium]|jgi:hexosaminidase|nr:beta-N-acetylhexosaminidase [Bacteroidales bacterium]
MKNLLYLIVVITASLITGCTGVDKPKDVSTYAIIPAPVFLEPLDGNFTITGRTKIVVSELTDETKLAADFLALMVGRVDGITPSVSEGRDRGGRNVVMVLDEEAGTGTEGYMMTIRKSGIRITAETGAGLFYAVQTIRQLLPPEIESPLPVPGIRLTVPACEITDNPRFLYRGMHLDVCRHMFPMEYIKRYIDMLALHKMNVFHWHLTDDQGWRIEINKYPRLTEVGGFRKETLKGHGGRRPFEFDGKPYGGFYTREEVREVVEYARQRFITVIPEIEMPGHAVAALAAYPELSCTGGPFEVETRWGVFDDVFCAGKEETFTFLQDVLDEVIELFPSEYIHIGGDECPKTRWKVCSDCQKRISDEGLADEHELQSYFIRRIENYLLTKGKRIIGWDEILEGGLAPQATVMSWRGTSGGIAAARQGHDVIMTPNPYLYIDHYQTEPAGEPLAIGGYSPLEWVYSYEPVPEALNEQEQKHILGLQGNLWSEYLKTPEHMEYMAYPRMFAVAETGWTPAEGKNFEEFLARFLYQKPRYDLAGINYFKGDYRNTRGRTR